MIENIQRFPAVFTEQEHQTVIARTVAASTWQFAGYSNTPDSTKFWFLDLGNDAFFTQLGLERIQELSGTKFELDRVYANGQTHGLSGDLHQDVIGGDDSYKTFIYYVGPLWQPEWGGATIFYDSQAGTIFSNYPQPNSGVLFNSNIFHQGQEPTRQCKELRVTVAWKLKMLYDK
jgi:Rps23 Pro-64 3,4-dihydroxylase Tpa1-like proline 4-hydroxylase